MKARNEKMHVAPNTKGRSKTIRVGLLGLGNVGAGVAEILAKHQAMISQRAGGDIEVVRALVRTKKKKRSGIAKTVQTTTRVEDIVGAEDIDIVVELLGGIERNI